MTIATRPLIEREVREIRDAVDEETPTRLTIAREVALVVARFVGDGKMADWIFMGAADLDHPAYVEALEDFVRAHGEEARGVNLDPDRPGIGGLLGPILHDLAISEDFNRIMRGDQWMAFDGSEG
jgi:hypothetical protein